MKTMQIEITVDEANLILEALGQLPFVKVYALIGKLQEQARTQLGGGDVAPPSGTSAEAVPSVDEG